MTRLFRRARRSLGARAALFVLPVLLGGWVATATGRRAPTSYAVQIRNFAFDPSEVSVVPGDTVVFTNRDGFLHTVSDDDRVWDSGTLTTNQSWTLVVTGPASFHCGFHPSMRGELVVR
jgi:plastocyanin